MSADGTRRDCRLHLDDPEMFTQPMDFDRYWAWRPEIALQPFGRDQ